MNMVKLLVLLATMSYVAVASAEHGRPGSNVGVDHSGGKVGIACIMQLEELEPCMDAVEGDAPFPPVPSDDCCFAVKTVDPACVCSAISKIDPSEYSGLNIQAALLLPTLCGRYVPQNFTCAGCFLSSGLRQLTLIEEYVVDGDLQREFHELCEGTRNPEDWNLDIWKYNFHRVEVSEEYVYQLAYTTHKVEPQWR